jgi:hypothetical protein
MKLDKRYSALIVASLVFGSSSALADTFDLDCVIKGEPALGLVDTNAVEQRVFGQKVETVSASDERIVIGFKREQVVVNRSDNTVFVDGKKMDNAVCEVKNYKVVAASAEQLSAQASSSASSSELSELQRRLVVLEEENEKLRKSVDDILDLFEYLADKNVSANERVIEKIKSIMK